MIQRADLLSLARAKLKDAQTLLSAGRYDSAAYLCGYAIELKLNARICRTLKWRTFPTPRSDFQDLTSLRTHNLAVLLLLSGIDEKIRGRFRPEWEELKDWNPEIRYNVVGSVSEQQARAMLAAATTLMRAI